MQIILLEKVANLGNLGDVVKVKDGYARNFLIPSRQARRATSAAVEEGSLTSPAESLGWARRVAKRPVAAPRAKKPHEPRRVPEPGPR